MATLRILSLLSCLAYSLAQPTPPTVTCDTSRRNQQITDQGALYWCGGDGRKMPLACLAPDGSRVDIGSSYWTDSAILECRQPAPDTLKLTQAACLKNSRRVDEGKTYNDGSYFYKCTRSADGAVRLQPTGCVGADGKEVASGSQVNQGSFVFTCNVNTGPGPTVRPTPAQPGPPAAPSPSQGSSQPRLDAVGCSFNGKQYKLGDDMELSGAWYKCTKDTSGAITSQLVGCVVNGTKYKLGDTWRDDFFGFRCEKLGGFVASNTYACVERYPNGTVTEYAPGRKWMVGSGSFNRYIISCAKQGIQLRRRSVACYYNTTEGQGVLDAGCMKKVGGIMIQCAPPGVTPNVRIRITENPTQADEERLKTQGLQFCESKPLGSVIN